jgi:cysteine desulfuration protein SufE
MQEKIAHLKKVFFEGLSEKEVYEKIIEFGRATPEFPESEKIERNIVTGCQSLLFLTHSFEHGKIYFNIHSEALISKGLSSLLVYLYSEQEPKKLFTDPPICLQEMSVLKKISMTRQLGLANVYSQMKHLASEYL